MTTAGKKPVQADTGFVLACAAVFLSPMNYLRLPGIYFTATDLVAMIALAVMLVSRQLPRRLFGAATGLWMSGFLMLGGGLMLGSIANGSPVDLLVTLAQYAFSLIVLPLLLAGRSVAQVRIMLRVLMYSITVVMLFGIWVFHFVPHPPPEFVTPSGRLQSLVERENECAALGAIAVILLVYIWQTGTARLAEIAIALPALLYGIMLTGSNTGILVLAIGVLMLTLLTGSSRTMSVLLMASGTLVVVVATGGDSLLPEVFRERVLNGILAGDVEQVGTFSDRVMLIQEAIRVAPDRLLVGMGADQYRYHSAYHHPVHNTYLLLLNEGGLMSLSGLLLLLLTGLPAAFVSLSRRPTRVNGALTLTILLIYALVLNSFPHFYARFWNVPLILALSLSCAPGRAGAFRPLRSAQEIIHA